MDASTAPTESSMPGIRNDLVVREETTLSREENAQLENTALENFAHYARYSTDRSILFFAKVYRGDAFVGLAPVLKIVKNRSTNLLKPAAKRWLGPILGPLSRKTTYMVDSAFLAFQYATPFFCPNQDDQDAVRRCVTDHLKAKDDVDNVWIAEPPGDTAWAHQNGFETFMMLPMVHADVAGHTTIDSFLASLSKKRRKNYRQDRKCFEDHGVTIQHHEPPLTAYLAEQLHQQVINSAHHNDIAVPYEDLQNHKQAFLTQKQHALVATLDGAVIGFFSFFPNGDTIQQCHGGFDYAKSLQTKAYHNLMNAAIELAIEYGYQRVSFGPLNNETKRRAGTDLMPVKANLWCREGLTRLVTKMLFIKNFQVYTGMAE